MSPCEEAAKLSALLGDLREQIKRTMEAGELAGLAHKDVTQLLTDAVKLYAASCEECENEVPAIDSTVSTTEAMVVACALLRAQHMNPFDLALWFSRTTPKAL
jgi:hypothetical protein